MTWPLAKSWQEREALNDKMSSSRMELSAQREHWLRSDNAAVRTIISVVCDGHENGRRLNLHQYAEFPLATTDLALQEIDAR